MSPAEMRMAGSLSLGDPELLSVVFIHCKKLVLGACVPSSRRIAPGGWTTWLSLCASAQRSIDSKQENIPCGNGFYLLHQPCNLGRHSYTRLTLGLVFLATRCGEPGYMFPVISCVFFPVKITKSEKGSKKCSIPIHPIKSVSL